MSILYIPASEDDAVKALKFLFDKLRLYYSYTTIPKRDVLWLPKIPKLNLSNTPLKCGCLIRCSRINHSPGTINTYLLNVLLDTEESGSIRRILGIRKVVATRFSSHS